MDLPLARLELTRNARRRYLASLRMGPVLVFLVICFWQWLRSLSPNADIAGLMGQTSVWVSNLSGWFQFAMAVLGPLLFAPGAIAEERYYRTWPLLQLAQVSGSDIFVAKFIGAFIPTQVLILSCVPLQSIAAIFGGISIEVLIAQLIHATVLNAALCSLGLLASAMMEKAVDALTLTIAVLVAWIIVISQTAGHSATAAWSARWNIGALMLRSNVASLDWDMVWGSVIRYGTISVVLMVTTAILLERGFGARGFLARSRSRAHDDSAERRYMPIARLYAAGMRASSGVLLVRIAPLMAILFAFLPVNAVVPMVVLLLMYDVTSSMANARQTGALDLLYLTGEANYTLADGIYKAHYARALAFVPALAMYRVFEYYTLLLVPIWNSNAPIMSAIQVLVCAVVALVESVLLCRALVMFSCVAACTWGSPAVQVLKTLFANCVYFLNFETTFRGYCGVLDFAMAFSLTMPSALILLIVSRMILYWLISLQGIEFIILIGRMRHGVWPAKRFLEMVGVGAVSMEEHKAAAKPRD